MGITGATGNYPPDVYAQAKLLRRILTECECTVDYAVLNDSIEETALVLDGAILLDAEEAALVDVLRFTSP